MHVINVKLATEIFYFFGWTVPIGSRKSIFTYFHAFLLKRWCLLGCRRAEAWQRHSTWGRGGVGVAVPYFAFIVQFILPTTGRVLPRKATLVGTCPAHPFCYALTGRTMLYPGWKLRSKIRAPLLRYDFLSTLNFYQNVSFYLQQFVQHVDEVTGKKTKTEENRNERRAIAWERFVWFVLAVG